MITEHAHPSRLLRRALQANGLFSALSGVTPFSAAGPLSALLGPVEPVHLRILGAGLLAYAAGLFRNARRDSIRTGEAWLAVGLDGAWVLGSGGLLAAGGLTSAGNWTVAIVADFVLLFALLQFVGLCRIGRVSQ